MTDGFERSTELNGSEVHRKVIEIIEKYAAKGKLPELQDSVSGVECLVSEITGEILYRFVTWDDCEIQLMVEIYELAKDPRGYLDDLEGGIIKRLDGHRLARAANAAVIIGKQNERSRNYG